MSSLNNAFKILSNDYIGLFFSVQEASEKMGLANPISIKEFINIPKNMFGLAINIKTYNGHYLQAQNGGGGELSAKGTQPYEWETFWILPATPNISTLLKNNLYDGKKVWIMTSKGNFLCAENGGGREVIASKTTALEWETFTLEIPSSHKYLRNGAAFYLRSYNGSYLCAEGGGGREVNANRTTPNVWETFHAELSTKSIRMPRSPESAYYTIEGKYNSLGGAQGELGAPLKEMVLMPDGKTGYRRYKNGYICGRDNGHSSAANAIGGSLPEKKYRLTVDRIKCNEETFGPGSDEIWFRFIMTNSPHLNILNQVEKTRHFDFKDYNFDTNDDKLIDLELFNGILPDLFPVTVLGLEVDSEDSATRQMNDFLHDTITKDDFIPTNITESDRLMTAGFVINGVLSLAGFMIGGYIGGAPWGVLIGFSIGATLGGVAWWSIVAAGPDVIMRSRRIYTAVELRDFIGNLNLPSSIPSKDGLPSCTWSRDTNGDLLEHHRYSDEGDYTVTYRHHFS